MTTSQVGGRGRQASSRKGRSTSSNVLDTSIELFAEKGFAATSMRELARRSGLPISAFYYYYSTKYDVLISIIDTGMRDLHDRVAAVAQDAASAGERLQLLVAKHVECHLERPLAAHVADSELRSLTEVDRRRVVAQRRAYEEMFRQALRDGVESGEFSPGLDVAFATNLILTMATGVIHWFKPGGKKSRLQAAAGIAQHAHRMVL